jgi:hypothetical protein
MTKAIAFSKGSAISDNQKLDDEHHHYGDYYSIDDEIDNPGDRIVELRDSHNLLKFLLMGLFLIEPPNSNCP